MLSAIEKSVSEGGADAAAAGKERDSLRRRIIRLIGFRVAIVTCLLGVAIIVQAVRGVATTLDAPIGRFYLFIGLTYLLTAQLYRYYT